MAHVSEHFGRHGFFEALQASFVAIVVWWWWHLPVPGYSVAVIAVLAAAMSIHRAMSHWHKAVWMLLIGACLILEFRAIETEKRAEERNAFQSIANGIHETIAHSDKHFDATMGKTNDVLTSITGGTSYATVVPILGNYRPDRPLPLAIENHGSHILTGVSVTVYSSGIWIEATHESIMQSIADRINVGTLHPGERLVLGAQLRPEGMLQLDESEGVHNARRAFIYITAQNFSTEEYLDLAPKPSGGWRFRYQLERQFPTLSKKIPREPRTIEQIDWSDDANNLRYRHL